MSPVIFIGNVWNLKMIRFFHTVKQLRLIQWVYRLKYIVIKPRYKKMTALPRRVVKKAPIFFLTKKNAYQDCNYYRFLNVSRDIAPSTIWQDKSAGLLWLYHLHYFDDLHAQAYPGKGVRDAALMTRWIDENPCGYGVGFAPYPLSLRIVNWIKWGLKGNTLTDMMLNSLCEQTALLSRRIEYHLLGNHVMANAKALIFSGLFFEKNTWASQGMTLFLREIQEQVLEHGAHFELSPLYHAIILEDMLDVIMLCRLYDYPTPVVICDAIQPMLHWLSLMTHPDGSLAHFNDTAQGISATLAELTHYTNTLLPYLPPLQEGVVTGAACDGGIWWAHTFLHLQKGVVTGVQPYLRFEHGPVTLIADCADVQASYQPGHTHADTLSFELSLEKQRIFVNAGTSTYEPTLLRLYERSTCAHNTVSVNNGNSSDVWHNFRLGKRAVITERTDNSATLLECFGKIQHKRCFDLRENRLIITDTLLGRGEHLINQFFNLMPGLVHTPLDTHCFDIQNLVKIAYDSKTLIHVRTAEYAPEFGQKQVCQKIITELRATLPIILTTTITWAL